jgi:hypothetical protein
MFPQDSTGSLAGKHAGKPSTARLDRPPCRSLHAFVILLLLGLGFFIAWNERGRTRRGFQASSSTASYDQLEPQAASWSQTAQHLPERPRAPLITSNCGVLFDPTVPSALAWLARQQHSDGSWSLSGPFQGGVDPAEPVMATALAMLTFQGSGQTDREGKHKPQLLKAKTWLLASQQADGSWVADRQDNQRSVQGLASLALCELFRMTGDAELKPVVEPAIQQCASRLAEPFADGTGRADAEAGMAWLLMALRSAKGTCGLSDTTLVQIGVVLDRLEHTDPPGRADGSTLADGALPASPAPAAMLCRVLWDWQRADPLVQERVQRWPSGEFWPRGNPWDDAQPYGRDVQSWYFATQVLHACRGPAWDRWNAALRSVVPQAQVKTGRNAGSWDPDGDRSGQVGGRLMVTCLATCALQVYYRYLPIYDHK